MVINSNNNDHPTHQDDELSHSRSILRPGAKVFLRHAHPPGFLHAKATWQGEYHMAHIREGPAITIINNNNNNNNSNAKKNNQFRALWKRNGYSSTITHTLYSPTDVMACTGNGMMVQIEDDVNGAVHSAKIVDLCQDRPGEVKVKWDRGDEQLVYLSQVSLGRHRRKKRSCRTAAAAKTAVAKKSRAKSKKAGSGKRKRTSNAQQARKEDIEVISIDSSSSEDEDGDSSSQPAVHTPSVRRGAKESAREELAETEEKSAASSSSEDGEEGSEQEEEKRPRVNSFPEGDSTFVVPGSSTNEAGKESEDEVAEETEEMEISQEVVNFLATQEESMAASLGRQQQQQLISDGELESMAATDEKDSGDAASNRREDAAAEKPTSENDAENDELGNLHCDHFDVAPLATDEDETREAASKRREDGAAGKPTSGNDSEKGEGADDGSRDNDENVSVLETSTTSSSRQKSFDSMVDVRGKVFLRRSVRNKAEDEGVERDGEGESIEMEEESGGETGGNDDDNENWTADNDTDDDEDDDDDKSEREDQSESETDFNSRESEESCSDVESEGHVVASFRKRAADVATLPSEESDVDDGVLSSDGSDESSVAQNRGSRRNGTRASAKKAVTRERRSGPPGTSRRGSNGDKRTTTRKERRMVTPREKNRVAVASRSSTPYLDENPSEAVGADDASESGVLLHGFCRSIPQLRDDPYRTIEEVQNMLAKARECKRDSEEFRETLVDANMLLQQILFKLNERTKYVRAPDGEERAKNSPPGPISDGNRSHIVRLAKQFGLTTREDVDDLFTRIGVDEHGHYSINNAIPKIMEMNDNKKTDNTSEEEKSEEVDVSNDREWDAVDGGDQDNQQLDLLGSRVRTVFENGREYEGTISTVHYRVSYDDGDTETLISKAEAFENLACNDKFHLNGPSVGGEDLCCSALEIFSGCSLLSTLCKRKGMNVMSIDTDMDSNATIKADFSSNYVQHLLSSQTFDFVHASPVCSTYSLMAGGKHRNHANYNRTRESHEGDAMLMKLYFFLAKALKKTDGMTTVTIENPRAWMRHGNIMKELFEKELGFKRFTINYCQFGRGDMKPTNIWTNDWKLGNILETIGGKCDCSLPHEDSVRRTGNKVNFAALPLKLCQIITSYVHSKHTQLRFENFAKNGKSIVPRDILNEE